MTLTQSIIEQDHRLEAGTEKASEALARHRWHWTLDESNADRVAVREYARSVGRSSSTITKYVNGYVVWHDRDIAISLSEAIDRANIGVEKQAAIEAVAEARGLSFTGVRQDRPAEVKRVRELAREAAERKGTTVADEVATVAEVIVRGEEVDARAEVAHKERHSLRYIEVEKHLLASLRTLRLALTASDGIPFSDDERDMLRASVEQLTGLIRLIDARLAGVTALDWDAELEKIMEGVK